MQLPFSRRLGLGAVSALVAWGVYCAAPARAQGGRTESEPSYRARLLCEFARTLPWPETNRVMVIAMVHYERTDADDVRQILNKLSPSPWPELWVTNYSRVPTDKELGALPGCGILAINGTRVPGNRAARLLTGIADRTFLTVGDGFQQPMGAVHISQQNVVRISADRLAKAGLKLPPTLLADYRRRGILDEK